VAEASWSAVPRAVAGPQVWPQAAVRGLRDLIAEQAVTVSVRGGCMEPQLADRTRVELVRARIYQPGDVLAFAGANGRLLLHRLLGYRWHAGRLCAVTRGDGNERLDFPVPLAAVLGRVKSPSPTASDRLRSAAAFLRLACSRLLRR
jgi:hypothetical protein